MDVNDKKCTKNFGGKLDTHWHLVDPKIRILRQNITEQVFKLVTILFYGSSGNWSIESLSFINRESI